MAALPADLRYLVAEDLAATGGDEARRVCRRAVIAARASGRGVGRERALAACAATLGITRRALEPYARLCTCFELDEIERILVRRNIHGRLLTAHHLFLLLDMLPVARNRWIEQALAEGLDVRALRERLRADRRLRGAQ